MRILRFLVISGKQLFINYNYYMNISQNSEIISSLIQKEQSIIFCSIAIFSVFWQLEKQEQIIFSLVNAFRFPTSRFSCHIKPITRGAVSDSASRCHCWWIKYDMNIVSIISPDLLSSPDLTIIEMTEMVKMYLRHNIYMKSIVLVLLRKVHMM